jgi:hypothetical protein
MQKYDEDQYRPLAGDKNTGVLALLSTMNSVNYIFVVCSLLCVCDYTMAVMPVCWGKMRISIFA